MRGLSCLFRYLVAGGLLSLSGCIKDPCHEPPGGPKPEWLLTRIVALETQGEPEGGPTTYRAYVEEYRYNKRHKPWLHIHSFGPDTNHLQVRTVDTLFFDNKLRVNRKGTASETGNKTSLRYFYTGNERYPYREEEIITLSDGTVSDPIIRDFLYGDTTADIILQPYPDTLRLVYNQGNYIGLLYPPPFGLQVEFDSYDNNTNVGRYLNLDFGRVLDVPENRTFLLFSRNNWTNQIDINVNSRVLTYDAEGKVTQSVIRYSHPTREVVSHYYYTRL